MSGPVRACVLSVVEIALGAQVSKLSPFDLAFDPCRPAVVLFFIIRELI